MVDETGFSTTDILEALKKIYREKRSGHLSLPYQADVLTLIFFQEKLASVDVKTIQGHILPYLIEHGVDTQAIFPEAPTPTSIAQMMAVHSEVQEFLYSALEELLESPIAPTINFQTASIEPSLKESYITTIPDLIINFFNIKLSAASFKNYFPDFKIKLFTGEGCLERTKGLALTPQQGYILTRIQNGLSLHELLMSCGVPEELVLRTLRIFLFFDVIYLEKMPGAATTPTIQTSPPSEPSVQDAQLNESSFPAPSDSAKSVPDEEQSMQDLLMESAVSGTTPSRPETPAPPQQTIQDVLLGNAPLAGPATTGGSPQPREPSVQDVLLADASPPTAPEHSVSTQKSSEHVSQELMDEINDIAVLTEKNNYYELLEADIFAEQDEIKKKFVAMTKKYHPDKFQQYNDPDLQEKVDSIFSKITEAWEVLKDPVRREKYNEFITENTTPLKTHDQSKAGSAPAKKDREQKKHAYEDREHKAKQHFIHGKEDYIQKRYHDAVEHFREAVRLMSATSEYQFMLGKTLSMNPQKVKEAEERLKFAYDQNPKKLEFVLELARFYIKVNLKHRANRYYEQVLVLKPNHDEAMRMLGRKKKTKKKEPRSFKDYLKMDFKDIFKSDDD